MERVNGLPSVALLLQAVFATIRLELRSHPLSRSFQEKRPEIELGPF